jgi:hypothetical protein
MQQCSFITPHDNDPLCEGALAGAACQVGLSCQYPVLTGNNACFNPGVLATAVCCPEPWRLQFVSTVAACPALAANQDPRCGAFPVESACDAENLVCRYLRFDAGAVYRGAPGGMVIPVPVTLPLLSCCNGRWIEGVCASDGGAAD